LAFSQKTNVTIKKLAFSQKTNVTIKKLAFSQKKQCYDQIFAKASSSLAETHIFLPIFWRKYF
jgi:hypothetical protein